MEQLSSPNSANTLPGSGINPCDHCAGYGAWTSHNGLRLTCRSCNGTGLFLPPWPRSQTEWANHCAWWNHIKYLESQLDNA